MSARGERDGRGVPLGPGWWFSRAAVGVVVVSAAVAMAAGDPSETEVVVPPATPGPVEAITVLAPTAVNPEPRQALVIATSPTSTRGPALEQTISEPPLVAVRAPTASPAWSAVAQVASNGAARPLAPVPTVGSLVAQVATAVPQATEQSRVVASARGLDVRFAPTAVPTAPVPTAIPTVQPPTPAPTPLPATAVPATPVPAAPTELPQRLYRQRPW